MHCPKCGHHDTHVKDSRLSRQGTIVRRRRICLRCEGRFTTIEQYQARELYVIKRDGRREPYSQEKLQKSLSAALHKRAVTPEQIAKTVAQISAQLENHDTHEIPTAEIRLLAGNALADLDAVGHMRFVSFAASLPEIRSLLDRYVKDDSDEGG